MNGNSLPRCRHRGAQFAPDRWVCASPDLVVPEGVSADVCASDCPFVDRPVNSNGVPGNGVDYGRGYGVAIGTYDTCQPGEGRYGVEAVELNLAVLRANCGTELKILVCDDASPAESQRRYRSLCARYGAEFATNRFRLGHTAGDMNVFHKAIRWAHHHRLRTVTKLSHRMMLDAPNWVQHDSEELIRSGHGTQTQMLANFGLDRVRTECVMMVVQKWFCREVLDHYRPRPLPWWNELHTFQAIRGFVDRDRPFPGYLPWRRLAFLRGEDRPPVYFRHMAGDALQEFHRLAAKYGVSLSRHFSIADSCLSADYV